MSLEVVNLCVQVVVDPNLTLLVVRTHKDVVIKNTDSFWIGNGFYRVFHLKITNLVYVNPIFQDNRNQCF